MPYFPYNNITTIILIILLLLFPSTLSFHQSKLRFIEEKEFLPDEITKAEHNEILSKYLSTKYLYWDKTAKGQHIKIGIFDSGFNTINPFPCHIQKQDDYTNEQVNDLEGHGTYIASLICSSDKGIAPLSEVFIYKVFNSQGKTKTEWIISAMKQAIEDGIDIMNFSFGGINFNDKALIALINKAVNSNIIIVSSAGNDGPSQGTIVFPGSLPNVITVGACSADVFSIYKHSSRGPAMNGKMTLIPKPNTWAPGEGVVGYASLGGKLIKNGSSIATAIVTGFVSLLLSLNKENRNKINNAVLMGMIYDSNIDIVDRNEYESMSGLYNPQGMLILASSDNAFEKYLNDIRILNYDHYDFNKDKTKRELYSSIQPLTLSFITLNTLTDVNAFQYPLTINIKSNSKNTPITFIEKLCVELTLIDKNKDTDNDNDDHNKDNANSNNNIVFLIKLKLSSSQNEKCEHYRKKINWKIVFTDFSGHYSFYFNLSFDFIPKPSKLSRILIDRYHNLIYPYDGLVPKDDLLNSSYDYDWTYESIATNYNSLYSSLVTEGYYIEELNQELSTCNLSAYAVLMIIDQEKAYTKNEIDYLRLQFEDYNLSVLIITEWNDDIIMNKFKDKNIMSSYGSELDSLNSFLINYSIAIGKDSISKEFYLNNHKIKINSGSSIALFPSGGILFGGYVSNDEYLIDQSKSKSLSRAVVGLYETHKKESNGRIGIVTDSYCIDDYQMMFNKNEDNCLWLIVNVVRFLVHGHYAYNEMELQSRQILIENYYNDEKINGVNASGIIGRLSMTQSIPNVLEVNYRKEIGLGEKVSFWEIVESALSIFVPISIILIIGYIIIQIKAENNKRRRMNAIQSLSNIRPRGINSNNNNRMKRGVNINIGMGVNDDTRSMSSERSVTSEMDLIA